MRFQKAQNRGVECVARLNIGKMRSMLTIAMMVALNRPEELRLHLRAAVNTGVSREEIREVLLHAAIYCGVPAANHAFQVAEEVFTESRS